MSRSYKKHNFSSVYTGNASGKEDQKIAHGRIRMQLRTAINGLSPDELEDKFHFPTKHDGMDLYNSAKDGMGYNSYYDALWSEQREIPHTLYHWGLKAWNRNRRK